MKRWYIFYKLSANGRWYILNDPFYTKIGAQWFLAGWDTKHHYGAIDFQVRKVS